MDQFTAEVTEAPCLWREGELGFGFTPNAQPQEGRIVHKPPTPCKAAHPQCPSNMAPGPSLLPETICCYSSQCINVHRMGKQSGSSTLQSLYALFHKSNLQAPLPHKWRQRPIQHSVFTYKFQINTPTVFLYANAWFIYWFKVYCFFW